MWRFAVLHATARCGVVFFQSRWKPIHACRPAALAYRVKDYRRKFLVNETEKLFMGSFESFEAAEAVLTIEVPFVEGGDNPYYAGCCFDLA